MVLCTLPWATLPKQHSDVPGKRLLWHADGSTTLSITAAQHVTGHQTAWPPRFVLRTGCVADQAPFEHLLPPELVCVSPAAHRLVTCRRCAAERHPTCCACWVPHWTAWALLQLRQRMSWHSNCGRWSWGGCRPAAQLPKWVRYGTLPAQHIVLSYLCYMMLRGIPECRLPASLAAQAPLFVVESCLCTLRAYVTSTAWLAAHRVPALPQAQLALQQLFGLVAVAWRVLLAPHQPDKAAAADDSHQTVDLTLNERDHSPGTFLS